jgi:hypothetical protein
MINQEEKDIQGIKDKNIELLKQSITEEELELLRTPLL